MLKWLESHLECFRFLVSVNSLQWLGCYDPYANPKAEFRNLIAVLCRRLIAYQPFVRVQSAVAWLLVFLTFIEPPVWCQSIDPMDERGCDYLLNLQGIAAGETNQDDAEPVYYYPNSRSMLLTTQQSRIIEWICLSLIGFFILLRIGRYVHRDFLALNFFVYKSPFERPSILMFSLIWNWSVGFAEMACLSVISFVRDEVVSLAVSTFSATFSFYLAWHSRTEPINHICEGFFWHRFNPPSFGTFESWSRCFPRSSTYSLYWPFSSLFMRGLAASCF